MRSLLYPLLLLLGCCPLSAQSVTPEVVATAGTTFTNGTVTLEWTLGEIMTETYSGSLVLTQGFHQPLVNNASPIARCQENITVQIDAAGALDLSPERLDNGSTDAATAAEDLLFSLDFGDVVLDCDDVDEPAQPVSLVVTNMAGLTDTCLSLVTVEDTIPPALICQDVTLAIDEAGNRITPLAFVDSFVVQSSDNCGAPQIIIDTISLGCANFGDNDFSVVAFDQSFNVVSCDVVITVTDPFFNCQTLPVEWLSFAAHAGAKEVDLQWETTEAPDNAGFHIERSAGGTTWSVIGQVDARSGPDQGYDFTDTSPLNGINYYRLRQTDFDGQVSYSPVEIIEFYDKARITLYPNPASQQVNIGLPDGTRFLGLLDVNGRLAKANTNGLAGQVTANLRGLPQGLYLVRVRLSSGELVARRLIVR